MSSKKEFTAQESRLTFLIQTNDHVKSLYNLVISVVYIALIAKFLAYLTSPQEFYADIGFWTWSLSGLENFLMIWLQMHLGVVAMWYSLKLFEGQKFLFTCWYLSFVVLFMILPAQHISNHFYNPPLRMAITMEQTRLLMKAHSVVIELFYQKDRTKKDQEEKPSLWSLIYFLFAPVLIYKPSYPRSEKINLKRALSCLLQFAVALYCMQIVLFRFVKGNYGKAGLEPIQLKALPHLLLYGSLVGVCILFMGWYALLHCWLNFWAEVLRFGDRKFYEDWWTSENYVKHFRRWNIVVHDWLHRYAYEPVLKASNRRGIASLSTFLLSAIFHEYIMTALFGFFYPLLAVLFIGVGLVAFYITGLIKGYSTALNMFLFGTHFIGYSLLIAFFGIEWHARENCQPTYKDNFWDSIYPRTFSCVTLAY